MSDWLLLFIAYWLGCFLAMMLWIKRSKKDVDTKTFIGVFFTSVLMLPTVILALLSIIIKRMKR
jgi:hypothetical protein